MTVTRFEYDDVGRMVRSVTVQESEWRAEDVSALIASRQVEQETGAHGIRMSEALAAENQFKFEGHIVRDWAQKAREDAMEKWQKANEGDAGGVLVSVRKRG